MRPRAISGVGDRGYSKDAEDECRAFFDSTELAEVKRTKRIIKLLTVQSRHAGMDEEHVPKM